MIVNCMSGAFLVGQQMSSTRFAGDIWRRDRTFCERNAFAPGATLGVRWMHNDFRLGTTSAQVFAGRWTP
jgi:hypothetical protein